MTRAPLVVVLALLAAMPAGIAAQQRIAVLPEPGTPVVAAEFLVTTGPLDEEESLAGLAYLAARAVTAPTAPALDSLGATLNLAPQKDAISFSIIAAPDAWADAAGIVLRALFRDSVRASAVEREREAIVVELRGRSANPADAATREADQAFFGLGHPWGRPTVGTPASVGRLLPGEVEAFARANFTPDRTLAAVVGPVDEREVERHLRPMLGETLPSPIEVDPFHPSERPVREPYNSITTWVTASFTVPETADVEAVRFVAYLARDALSFSPSQRSIYNVSSEVTPRVGSAEVRLQVVTPPEEADAWAERVEEVVRELASEPMLPDVFAGHLRRFAGERLMALVAPEDRAHAAVRQLLVAGRFAELVPTLAGMTQERVRAAARSLGTPAIVLLGPELDPQ